MTLLLQAGAVRAWFTSHNLTHIWPKKIKRWFITPRAARVLARSDPVGETWWDVSLEQIWALLSGVQQKRLTEMWGCRELWESVCAPEGKTGSRNGPAQRAGICLSVEDAKGKNTQRNILGEWEGNDPWRGFPWAQCQVVTLRKPSLFQGPLQPSYLTRKI